MENKELVETIRGILKEESKPIREETSKVKDRLAILEIKEQIIHKKFDSLTLDVKIAERDTRRGIAQTNDTIETLIAALETKGALPKTL